MTEQSVAQTLSTFSTVDEVPEDVTDCWIGEVLYHRCGAGRKNQRKNAVDACGKLKPHCTPEYHANALYAPNAMGHSVAITCAECITRHKGRAAGRPKYHAETPSDNLLALVPEHADQFWDNEKDLHNLTAMHKVSGERADKSPSQWLRLPSTAELMAELERQTMGLSHSLVQTREGRSGGTWAHWQLAVAYAKYLSPAFHIQWNKYAAAYLRGEQRPAEPTVTPMPEPVAMPANTPGGEYMSLLQHFTGTADSMQVLRRHFDNIDRVLDGAPAAYEALQSYLDSLKPLADAAKRRRNPLTHGWVYVLYDPRNKRHKIGMTQDPDPQARQKGVEGQWGKGQSVQVIWVETTNVRLEKAIQAFYKRRKQHIGDEWYRLSDADVDCLRKLGPMLRYEDFTPTMLETVVIVQSDLFNED